MGPLFVPAQVLQICRYCLMLFDVVVGEHAAVVSFVDAAGGSHGV